MCAWWQRKVGRAESVLKQIVLSFSNKLLTYVRRGDGTSLTRCRGSRRPVAWKGRCVPRLARVGRGSWRPESTWRRRWSWPARPGSWSRRRGPGTGESATWTPRTRREGARTDCWPSSDHDEETTSSMKSRHAQRTHLQRPTKRTMLTLWRPLLSYG